MKHLFSILNGEEWRKYSERAANYGAALRAMGLPYDHEARQRARAAIRRGLKEYRHERWQFNAARRLIAVLEAQKKKALAA